MPFCQLDIMSACQMVNLPFCQLGILSTWHFINLTYCQLDILSKCHFTNFISNQLDILLRPLFIKTEVYGVNWLQWQYKLQYIFSDALCNQLGFF